MQKKNRVVGKNRKKREGRIIQLPMNPLTLAAWSKRLLKMSMGWPEKSNIAARKQTYEKKTSQRVEFHTAWI
jgi:hypothetical protein